MLSEECSLCEHFKPHLYYHYIGLCDAKKEVRGGAKSGETCYSFKLKTLNVLASSLAERGWVYCVSCRRTLVNFEELREHLDANHEVFKDVLIDDVVADEAPSGD